MKTREKPVPVCGCEAAAPNLSRVSFWSFMSAQFLGVCISGSSEERRYATRRILSTLFFDQLHQLWIVDLRLTETTVRIT